MSYDTRSIVAAFELATTMTRLAAKVAEQLEGARLVVEPFNLDTPFYQLSIAMPLYVVHFTATINPENSASGVIVSYQANGKHPSGRPIDFDPSSIDDDTVNTVLIYIEHEHGQ